MENETFSKTIQFSHEPPISLEILEYSAVGSLGKPKVYSWNLQQA